MRWLLTSCGSKGDFYPFLALGRGLAARGHEVTLVGAEEWRAETEAGGLRFASSGEPSLAHFIRDHPQVLSTAWRGLASTRILCRDLLARATEPTCHALLELAPEHDIIVAHHFVLAAPVAAEKTRTPWATVTLAPCVIPSVHTSPGADYARVRDAAWWRWRNRLVWDIGRLAIARMMDPTVNRLRAELDLPPAREVIFGRQSPRLNLQLYSRHFAAPAPDWGHEIRQAGFCFHDGADSEELAPALRDFLAGGDAPILFTLGSTAVQSPGEFFANAARALQQLGRRGILLIGPEENRPAHLAANILALPYAPYGPLMPRVAAVFHQGGIGTLAHTLRAGVPSVVCPYAFDQPNNARRLEALGVAEVLPPGRRDARAMARALQRLLEGKAAAKARQIGAAIRSEDGVASACALLEETFRA
jgi:UDP:flavonoid glycosyltransferase YjiC (YdhE family)